MGQVEQLQYASVVPADEPARKRGRFFLILTVALVGFAMSIQMGLNPNFVGQTMGLSGQQQGILEASRESCGIIGLGILAILAGLSEPRIGVIMLVLLSAGLSAYAVVPSFGWLVLASFVWSQGFMCGCRCRDPWRWRLGEKGARARPWGTLGAAGGDRLGRGDCADAGAALPPRNDPADVSVWRAPPPCSVPSPVPASPATSKRRANA